MPRQYHRTVVRREHPVYTPLRRALWVIVGIVVALGAFWGGRFYHLAEPVPPVSAEDELRRRIIELETELAMEGAALATLREELAGNRAELDELQRELSFYREVMAPEDDTGAIVLRDPQFETGSSVGQWRYSFIVQQGQQSKERYRGDLLVTFWGNMAGVPKAYTLDELDASLVSQTIALNFRYFQRVEGTLMFPVGFEVNRVEMQASITRPKTATVEREVLWP